MTRTAFAVADWPEWECPRCGLVEAHHPAVTRVGHHCPRHGRWVEWAKKEGEG